MLDEDSYVRSWIISPLEGVQMSVLLYDEILTLKNSPPF